ncbi:hypothetical protein HOLleu_37178 [Holothuria leucospilota]|uniref:Uncharacterized protein n=1 Tax=Holothuria leucospilota TaxID=206669 RepID=A0A9Q0YGQ7_HOLLE|nr:hypothetical protein HOLleu_37178 [Holothuria leucospilota]
MRNDSEKIYRRKLDKWKARSNRILTKAYNLNRTYDNHLEHVLKDLERNRDIAIREAQEKIWNVSNSQCPKPRLPRQSDMPSYLAQPKLVSLPTPAELSSLLPKKLVKQRPETRKQYTRMSTRKLSVMTCDQVKIEHYRLLLKNEGMTQSSRFVDKTDSIVPEVTIENSDDPVQEGWENNVMELKRNKSPVTKKSVTYLDEPSVGYFTPGQRPLSSPPKEAQKVKVKQRPKTGMPKEIAVTPSGKVWKTNYLRMYHQQAEKHKRRMSQGSQVPFEKLKSRKIEEVKEDGVRKDSVKSVEHNTQSTSNISLSQRGLHNRLQESNEKPTSKSTLMSPTASSQSRRKSTRHLFRRVNSLKTMEALHQEVQSIEQARTFKRDSLQTDGDLIQEEYLEDGELFDSMRKCRYIRWGKDDALVEELNEDIPLENQLKILTLSVPNG